jgi:hypothetical protein
VAQYSGCTSSQYPCITHQLIKRIGKNNNVCYQCAPTNRYKRNFLALNFCTLWKTATGEFRADLRTNYFKCNEMDRRYVCTRTVFTPYNARKLVEYLSLVELITRRWPLHSINRPIIFHTANQDAVIGVIGVVNDVVLVHRSTPPISLSVQKEDKFLCTTESWKERSYVLVTSLLLCNEYRIKFHETIDRSHVFACSSELQTVTLVIQGIEPLIIMPSCLRGCKGLIVAMWNRQSMYSMLLL